MAKLIKSKERVRDFGEVFTPEWLVKDMVDLLADKVLSPMSKVLEPTCGTGNFLTEILERKINWVLTSDQKRYYKLINLYLAFASLYGVDIQQDNVNTCQRRLKHRVLKAFKELNHEPNDWLLDFILLYNIRRGDTLKDTFLFADVVYIFNYDNDVDVFQIHINKADLNANKFELMEIVGVRSELKSV